MHIEGRPITFSANGHARLPSVILSSVSSTTKKISLNAALRTHHHVADLLTGQG